MSREVSDSTNWVVFSVLALIVVVSFGLWLKFRPRINQYLAKNRKMDEINRAYNSLCRSRADVVYHYYWAVDSGELREASRHEARVLEVDSQLESLRLKFKAVQDG